MAPSISPGEIDYLLAFEAAEGLRLAPSLAPDGLAIVNTQQIVPPSHRPGPTRTRSTRSSEWSTKA